MIAIALTLSVIGMIIIYQGVSLRSRAIAIGGFLMFIAGAGLLMIIYAGTTT
jgi:hypothetical protein